MKKAYNVFALCYNRLAICVLAVRRACAGINCFKAAEHSCDSRKGITQDIKGELGAIQKSFTDKVNEYRAANFIDGEGLTLLNLSDKNEIKIGFAIDYYKLKSTL